MIDDLKIAKEKGKQEGLREMFFEALDEKVGIVTPKIVEKIYSINDPMLLKHILRQAIRSDNLSDFEGKLAQVGI